MTFLFAAGAPGLTCALIAQTAPPESRITVRLYNYSGASGKAVQQAKEIAAEIFQEIAVEVAWLDCFPRQGNEQLDPSCRLAPTAMAINLRLAEQSTSPEIFECGLAIPADHGGFSKHAIIFYECVRRLTVIERSTRVAVLGHVIAHELGHVLLGLGGHSAEGIMRYPWGKREIELADKGWLRFTPGQAERIRDQVRARHRADDAVSNN